MTDGTRCTEPGTDCDHIERGDNHDLTNLQWLCAWHHKKKTNREATEARRANNTQRSHLRPDEQHPALR